MGTASGNAETSAEAKRPRQLLGNPALFEPRTLDELLKATLQQIESCDFARMALLCAQGLPGAEDVGVTKYLRILDAWVIRIRATLTAKDHKFDENPAKYDFSRAKYRIALIASVLQSDYRIRYQQEKKGKTLAEMPDDVWYRDSRDFMLHGVLGRNRSGTCVSLPMLMTAVCRQLGFPVYIISVPMHLLCRWDDPVTGERFNIDWNGDGFTDHPDDHYQSWPVQWTEQMLENHRRLNIYLRSFTPTESLAIMLADRAACLEANGRFDEAMKTLGEGDRLFPENPGFGNRANELCVRMKLRRIRGSGISFDENTTYAHVSACPVPQRVPRDSIQAAWPFPCEITWGIAPPDRPSEISPMHSEIMDNNALFLRSDDPDAASKSVNVVVYPIYNSKYDRDLPFTYLQFPAMRRTDHVRRVQEEPAEPRPIEQPFS